MAEFTLHYSASSYSEQEVSDIGWLWVLRIYASGIIPLIIDEDGIPPFHLIPMFSKYIDENESIKHDFSEILKKELSLLESKAPSMQGNISQNIRWIGKKFHLNSLEMRILEFRYTYRTHQALQETLDKVARRNWMGNLFNRLIASALAVTPSEIEKALSPEGKLISSCLLEVNNVTESNFGTKLTVFPGLNTAISRTYKSANDLFKFAVTHAPKPKLKLDNFQHHTSDIEVIKRHIATAIKLKQKGVNILIYGQPGVGKTELARAISMDLNISAYEVPSDIDTNGINTTIGERMSSYVLLQNFLKHTKKSLVIFDEIEDVFPRPGLLDKPGVKKKVWVNNLIETNAVPTIWISNHVWQLDPAVLRRFDVVLEIKNLPRSARHRLLSDTFQKLPVDASWIRKLSSDPQLTPAIVNQTIRVIHNADISSPISIQNYFDSQLEERRRALGNLTSGKYKEPEEYRLDLLNTNINMLELTESLADKGTGRVLLYGPPGSGKTAFAHHLSLVADKPIMLKRGSDIFSKWVGETETNIREMFSEAGREDAILLLDEADSFLQSRKNAERSWEVSQVNELLTQMECYRGFFICATNFMKTLDLAAMRRFPFKVKFVNQRSIVSTNQRRIFSTLLL